MTKPKKTADQITPETNTTDTYFVQQKVNPKLTTSNSDIIEQAFWLIQDALEKKKLHWFSTKHMGPTDTIVINDSLRIDWKKNVDDKLSFEIQNNGNSTTTFATVQIKGEHISPYIIAAALIYTLYTGQSIQMNLSGEEYLTQFKQSFKSLLGVWGDKKYIRPIMEML
jgi:hypothetical protein